MIENGMMNHKDNRVFAETSWGSFAASAGRDCRYGMFARHGGVSRGVYASLNVGLYVGDEAEAVAANRQLVKETMEISVVLSARQVHGSKVYCLTESPIMDLEVDGYDALVTDQPGIGLMIQQADCQAVLLFDPRRQVIAAVHCGWRGSVLRLVPQVVEVMHGRYGTVAADLQAVISPSLGPCCAEFVNYKTELPIDFCAFMVQENYFDFWRITREQLTSVGVADASIRTVGHCTCCSDDYFSYRRAVRRGNEQTGRNCSVIALRGA